MDIDFARLNVDVRVVGTRAERKEKALKRVLHNAFGAARAGHLLAILGASGAGKSTLLDVLAAQPASSRGLQVSGEVLVNGQPRVEAQFRRVSCYVQQRDLLLASATVREAIMTSAQLKLPHSMSYSAKRERVEEVIRELGLEDCADTLVGDEEIGLKGISGGQKRRASVGIELIKDPSLLFLDEPTSGLDSEMALNVMDTLLSLARRNRTVVCTIHQPNSDITSLFDDLMLLAAGHIVYAGPWSQSMAFFQAHGHTVPMYKNPTDFYMSVMRDLSVAEGMWAAYESQAEQRYQEAIQSPASPQQQVGGDGVMSSKGSHIWLAIRSLSRTHRRAAHQSNQYGGPAGAAMSSMSATSKGASMSAPQHLLTPDTADDEPALQGGSEMSGSAAQLQLVQPVATQEHHSGRQELGTVHNPQQQHVQQYPDQQQGVNLPVSSPPPAPASTPAKGDLVHVVVRAESTTSVGQEQYSGRANASTGPAAPIWYQAGILIQRNIRNWLRNPNMFASELLQYAVISLFIGLMYFRSFTDDTIDGVTNRTACIWFCFAVMCFTPSYTSVTGWDKDRLLLKRELGQRQYNLFTFYVARTAVMIPFQAVQCMLFMLVMYFFAGFQRVASKFFTFYVTLLMFQLISEGLGLLCAIVTRTATYAIILLTFLLLLLLSFTGFLVTRIPVYFIWVNKISYLTYAFAGVVGSEFQGLTLYDPTTGELLPGPSAIPHSIDNGLTVSQNLGILACMVAGMELFKLAGLWTAHWMRII